MDSQNVENFPLDQAAIDFFTTWKARRDEAQARMNGAFELFLLQHELKGNWKLADNGKELERIPEQVPVQS